MIYQKSRGPDIYPAIYLVGQIHILPSSPLKHLLDIQLAEYAFLNLAGYSVIGQISGQPNFYYLVSSATLVSIFVSDV